MADDDAGVGQAKGGRPLKDAAKGKRAKYAFRMGDSTRAQIEGYANESGRSLSEEIEYRIEQSLQKDGRLKSVLTMIGGPEMIMFAAMMSGDLRIAIREADEKVSSKLHWYESPEKLELVCRHMQGVAGRSVETFARMMQTGVASRSGLHVASLAD